MTRNTTNPRWRAGAWVLLGLALVAFGGPARSDNPAVSLKLEKATAAEAVEALSKASGVPLSFQNAQPGPNANDRATFDWSGTTFARALRQLCQRFSLMPNRVAGGYNLYPSFQPPPGPADKPVGLVEKDGWKLSVRSVGIYENRGRNFGPNGADYANSAMTLQVGAEVGQGDADDVAGLDNVTARDDLGNVIAADPQNTGAFYSGAGTGVYPDEWSGSVNLPAPHPKAKKLVWLQGDVLVFKSSKPLRAEIPVPLSAKLVKVQVGDVLIAASRYQPAREAEDDDEKELPPPHINAPGGDGPTVRVRIYVPVGSRYVSRAGGWGMPPTMIGQSGKAYAAQQFMGGAGASDGHLQVTDTTWLFPNVSEKPVKLVWEFLDRSRPVKLFSFRMSDIPLPVGPAFQPKSVLAPRPHPAGEVPGAPDRPFYQKGGGTLTSRVEVAERPLAGNTLQLGLAPKTPSGWGPIRWIDVDLEQNGTVRLEDVKPGTYRLLRKMAPDSAAKLPAGGKWLNAALVVTVAAGKEAAVPPLKWVPAGGVHAKG